MDFNYTCCQLPAEYNPAHSPTAGKAGGAEKAIAILRKAVIGTRNFKAQRSPLLLRNRYHNFEDIASQNESKCTLALLGLGIKEVLGVGSWNWERWLLVILSTCRVMGN